MLSPAQARWNIPAPAVSERSQSPWVSVIIVCHNDGRWLPRCLESIRGQTVFGRSEVIIADNASSDRTDQVARDLIAGWSNATFLSTGGDHGFGVACNRAAEIARGQYLYLLNPDVWLEADCLQQLYETGERENAAAVGGNVLDYDDDTVQAASCRGFDIFGEPVGPRGSAVPHPLFVVACFQFIRRDVFQRIGMMDDRFFLYGEEMDLAWRIWISGGKLVPALNANIHHRGAVGVNPAGGARTIENRTSVQKRFLANRNRLTLIAKNGQHLLLLMLIPCASLVVLEGLLTWVMTRRWSLAKATSFDAIADFWRMRDHIKQQRRHIAAFRQRGDLWMMRFFCLGFARWKDVRKAFHQGFPKFNRN